MRDIAAIYGLSPDWTAAWTDANWIEWVANYELYWLSKGGKLANPARSAFNTDKDYQLYMQGIALAKQKYDSGLRFTGIDSTIIPDFNIGTAAYKDTYIDFAGAQSGQLLKSWKGYPSYYPRLQFTVQQIDGKDIYRLGFWNWLNEEPWLSYYGISYLPKGTSSNTGFHNVPLTSIELGRFLVGYENALLLKKTPKEAVAAGRASMYFRNEIVYNHGGKIYDPWTGSSMADLPAGGEWCWKWVDGWNMLWCAVQEYIDLFLKVPYNVRDLVAYGNSYENVLKDVLLKSNIAERREKLKNYLSNVDFLVVPVGKKDFWDKLADWAPAIMAGIITVFTAGAASPYLIAAGSLLVSQLQKAGKMKMAADLQKLIGQQSLNVDNQDPNFIDDIKNDIDGEDSSTTWLLVAAAAAAVYFFTRKKRRK